MSHVFRSTILQTVTPDRRPGRVAGIELAQVARASALVDVRAGVVASPTSLRFSVGSRGIAHVVGCAIAGLAFPALLRYDVRSARRQ